MQMAKTTHRKGRKDRKGIEIQIYISLRPSRPLR
jgi:hypothetical protein